MHEDTRVDCVCGKQFCGARARCGKRRANDPPHTRAGCWVFVVHIITHVVDE